MKLEYKRMKSVSVSCHFSARSDSIFKSEIIQNAICINEFLVVRKSHCCLLLVSRTFFPSSHRSSGHFYWFIQHIHLHTHTTPSSNTVLDRNHERYGSILRTEVKKSCPIRVSTHEQSTMYETSELFIQRTPPHSHTIRHTLTARYKMIKPSHQTLAIHMRSERRYEIVYTIKNSNEMN